MHLKNRTAVAYINKTVEEITAQEQKQIIEDYCKKKGIEIKGIFHYSFNEVISFVSKHKIDCVIVVKYKYINKDPQTSSFNIYELERQGIKVLNIVKENTDKKYNNKRSIQKIHEEFQEDVKRSKLNYVLLNKKKPSGYYPLGYNADGTVNDNEADLVKKIYEMYLKGYSSYKIAKWLNETGLKTKLGNKYSGQTVQYILKNVFYTGKVKYEDIIINGRHNAIIDEKTFKKVQKKLRKNQKRK
ncbi:Recombinase [Thermosipho melanesiensis BI429]|uniref:Recombinase n=2 Tax=Thermosipho melanesiensis TaxID=46541 RepID=A6LK12_THEM4|nr:Recombinase [Thermosipho melanesiensis BI429]